MQNKLLIDSTGYGTTFLIPIIQHTLVKNLILHKNSDFTYNLSISCSLNLTS